jgi:hypothetical protein
MDEIADLQSFENYSQAVVFLFTDQHVGEEGFLELINNLLTMGMVPALVNILKSGLSIKPST